MLRDEWGQIQPLSHITQGDYLELFCFFALKELSSGTLAEENKALRSR